MSRNLRSPAGGGRRVFLGAGGALVLAFLFAWTFVGQCGANGVMQNVEPRSIGSKGPETIDEVRLDQAERWRSHLSGGGTVRMSVDGNPPGREVDVVGLGHLEGSELAFARSSLQRVVDKRTKELISQYQASDNTQLAGEEAALREAEALLRSHKFEAFLRGFDRGEYFLVNGADVAPPIPEGYLALNVGVTHRGHPALCVIVIRKTNNGIDEIENLLQARRAAYLQKVAYQFNGKSDEERRRIIARYDANAEDDRQWRNVIFPAGLGIDRIRATLFVQ